MLYFSNAWGRLLCTGGVQKANQQLSSGEGESLLISIAIEHAAVQPDFGLIPRWLVGSAPEINTQYMTTQHSFAFYLITDLLFIKDNTKIADIPLR